MTYRPADEQTVVVTQRETWQEHRSALLGFFLGRVRDRSEAEDLAQEVCTRFLRRVPNLKSGAVRAYMFAMARNLLKDRARRDMARPVSGHALELDTHSGPMPQSLVEHITPERRLLDQEALAQALHLLDDLNERTRDIFLLYRLERMKHHEISELYGISTSAVEKHVAKAVAHLMAGMWRQ